MYCLMLALTTVVWIVQWTLSLQLKWSSARPEGLCGLHAVIRQACCAKNCSSRLDASPRSTNPELQKQLEQLKSDSVGVGLPVLGFLP